MITGAPVKLPLSTNRLTLYLCQGFCASCFGMFIGPIGFCSSSINSFKFVKISFWTFFKNSCTLLNFLYLLRSSFTWIVTANSAMLFCQEFIFSFAFFSMSLIFVIVSIVCCWIKTLRASKSFFVFSSKALNSSSDNVLPSIIGKK